MGLIREPEGVDFVISGGPLSATHAAEISAFISKRRAARAKVHGPHKNLEAEAIGLPPAERTQLVYLLLNSLAAEDLSLPEREWAANAKLQFEQIKASGRPKPKSRRRAKPTMKS